MAANDRTVVSKHVVSRWLGDELILLDTRNEQLFVLNEIAASIWLSLEDGLSLEAAAAEISRQTSAPLDDVLRDCRALAAEWRSSGLLDAKPADAPPERAGQHYRAAGFEFAVEGPTEVLEAIDQTLLGHLAFRPRGGDPDVRFTITTANGGWVLRGDEGPLGECERLDQLVPMVHANVLLATYGANESLMAIHAAAVSRGDRCVLLPGLPGNGKSTLTAALLAAGYGFCTDDLAMLTGEPLRLVPLPLRLGIKSGSWNVLRSRVPDLDATPSYLRADGQQIKYWLPPLAQLPPEGHRFNVAAVVFPRYRAGARCELAAIPRSVGLLRISEAGYHLQGRLDADWLEATLAWLEALACYELEYSDLDEALAAFAEVLR